MAELDSTLRTRFAQSKFAAKTNFFKPLVFKLPVLKPLAFKLHLSSHDLFFRSLVKTMHFSARL